MEAIKLDVDVPNSTYLENLLYRRVTEPAVVTTLSGVTLRAHLANRRIKIQFDYDFGEPLDLDGFTAFGMWQVLGKVLGVYEPNEHSVHQR